MEIYTGRSSPCSQALVIIADKTVGQKATILKRVDLD